MDGLPLSEYRCLCGKLLLKGIFFDSILEIKCKRCGRINNIGEVRLLESADKYLIIVDKKGNISSISDSASRILGYKSSELVGRHFTFINPSMPEEIGSRLFGPKSVLNSENYLQLETYHRHKTGKIIPITILLKIYEPIKKEKYVVALASLKKTKQGNLNKEKKVDTFLENACDFYFDIDINAMTEYISASAEKLFNLSSAKILGKSYFDFTPINSTAKQLQTFKYFLSIGQPYRIKSDIRLIAKGNKKNTDLYFTPRFNNNGKIIGYRVMGWVIKKRT